MCRDSINSAICFKTDKRLINVRLFVFLIKNSAREKRIQFLIVLAEIEKVSYFQQLGPLCRPEVHALLANIYPVVYNFLKNQSPPHFENIFVVNEFFLLNWGK